MGGTEVVQERDGEENCRKKEVKCGKGDRIS